jgi:hypothetical protein
VLEYLQPIRRAAVVAVRIERCNQPVAVAVRGDATGRLLTVAQAVAVSVRVAWVGPQLALGGVTEAVAVRIGGRVVERVQRVAVITVDLGAI